MPIFQTAHYEVEPAAVDDVRSAIVEFVDWVRANEPDTKMYVAWQNVEDPHKFVHLFEFEDEDAHKRHGSSDAVGRFEAVYRPVLTSESVTFTDYALVASNTPRAEGGR